MQSIASFNIASLHSPSNKIGITAVVVPCVICDLPLHPIPFDLKWNHLSGIQLADPKFGLSGRVDILLGVEVLIQVMMHGRQFGLPGSPIAFETVLGWVLADITESCTPAPHVVTHHVSLLTGDDLLHKF